jgi:diguanylate cyclase (GGDEF)-like protein
VKSIIATLEKLSRKAVFSISLFLVFILGISQYLMHGAINLDPVYILPVIISSWYGSKLSGIWVSLFSVLVLGVIEWGFWQGSLQITERLVFIGSHLATFLLAALIVTYFSITHRIEVDAADTDTLTGVHSVRSLQVELNNVLLRSKRYNRAFSLAYIDIDNFKKINDLHGHSTGDNLLKEVANCLVSSLRVTDIIARIGGDEYVCVLQETGQEEARSAFAKVIDLLDKKMKIHGWPVSFSVGVVTFQKLPEDINAAMTIADKLMYSVKNDKKNAVAYQVYQ